MPLNIIDRKNIPGNAMLEILIAVGLAVILMGAIAVMGVVSAKEMEHANQDHEALVAAQEGLHALRGMSFEDLLVTDNGALAFNSGQWELNTPGPEALDNGMTRIVRVANLRRDANCEIVETGGNIDNNSVMLESEVIWTNQEGKEQNILLTGHRTQWKNPKQNCFEGECASLTPTIYVDDNNMIVGGPMDGQVYAGTLVGTNKADIIFGTEAEDTISGDNGDDIICAFGGNDQIFADNHKDIVYAGDGDDMVKGGDGNDVLHGGKGDDVIDAEAGQDEIYGGDGADHILGGNDADLICAGNDNDYINGGNGKDMMDGGDGDDELYGGTGDDNCYRGEFYDSCEDTKTPIEECG